MRSSGSKMRITLPRLRFRAAYSSNTSLIGIHEELRKSPRMRIFGERFDRGIVHTTSTIGKPIIVKYDLERLSNEITRSSIKESKKPGFWRYSPLLPVTSEENMVSLGEVITPLIRLENLTMIFDSRLNQFSSKMNRGYLLVHSRLEDLVWQSQWLKNWGLSTFQFQPMECGICLGSLRIQSGNTLHSSLSGQYSRDQHKGDTDSRASTHIVNGLIGEWEL